MNDLHAQFVVEARELIHQAIDDLITVEHEKAPGDRIDRVFRAFHTLKGSAGVVALPPMILTLHAAEDMLAAIRGGRLDVTSPIVEAALACLDQASQWVDAFEAQGALPIRAGEDAQAMARRLRGLLATPEQKEPVEPDAGVPDESGTPMLAEWVLRLLQSERQSISRYLDANPAAALTAVTYEPRPGCFFDGEDPLGLFRRMPSLLALHVEEREAWPPLAELNPFACNLRLRAIAAEDRAALSEVFRLVPDEVRFVEIPKEALLPASGGQAEQADTELTRAILEEQRRVLNAPSEREALIGRIGAVARVTVNALRRSRRADLARRIEDAMESPGVRTDVAPLLSALDDALAALAPTPGLEDDDSRPEEPTTPQPQAGAAAGRSLRVDEAKIDALFNLASELIVAKNGLAHLARRLEDEIGRHQLAGLAKREHETIERLASEIHASILQLRMVPVAQAFRSLRRLVRDMSQRLGKKATLVTLGEETAADKTVVDRLFEPLLHLVRNAFDHGVETPDQRRIAGKAEIATITVHAARVRDRFVVEVADDGRGIDPQSVRLKARERELRTPHEVAALSDDEAVDLVFATGFSTASEISDISGRGVGMDVVRTSIEQMGGKVSLTSGVGVGTTVRLDLPVNIAMTRIMVVESGGQVFGIPMEAVTETVRLTPDRISRVKNNEGFVLRERILPICPLADLMNLPNPVRPAAATRLVVVIETGGRIAALEVDGFRERLEVVLKPLQGLLANTRGYAGTTLLGDGKVLLVLDTKEILP